MGTFYTRSATASDLTAPPALDSSIVELKPVIARSLPGRDIFEEIMQLDGDVYRLHKNRRTVRVSIGGRRYFVKAHGHSGWLEVFKNLYRLRLPVLTSMPEYLAIKRLHELDIPTMTCVGCGRRGRNPARLESFIVTEALEDYETLDEIALTWNELPEPQQARLRRRAIGEIARIARTLHSNGLNHRDFYIGHFMLRDRDWSAWSPEQGLTLHLIDLHRMQIRGHTPIRWLIKDLSGLLFSVLNHRMTNRDFLRFLKVYWGPGWKSKFRKSRLLRRIVIRRAIKLYRRKNGRLPRMHRGLASSS